MLENGSLRNSLIVSTCLHVGMLLFMFFGLPHAFKPLPSNHRPIPIDIVEIGAITNTNIGKTEETLPAASQTTKPAPPTPMPEEKKAEPVKPPEPKPEMKTATPPQEDEALLPAPKPKDKPKPPEAPKPEEKQAQQDMLASVLKNVAKLKPQAAPPSDAPKDAPKSDTNKTGAMNVTGGAQTGGFGPSLSDRLTISAEDALRRQIQQCWNIPAGARNAEELVVTVVIDVKPDRTVQSAQVADQARMSDPFFRAAAESALRALRNPKCSPLELPEDGYEQWKRIEFTFDPRDML